MPMRTSASVLYAQRRFPKPRRNTPRPFARSKLFATADPNNRDFQKSAAEALAWLADSQAGEGKLEAATATRQRHVALLSQAAAGHPALDETAAAKDGRMLTTRERMEMHRANPTCNSCHRFMDPIGLALDNFDVTGEMARRARTACRSTPRGDFYDGTPVTTPAELTRGAAEAADAAGAHVHREPDGLRARPARRVFRSAGDPRDRARRPKRTTTRCRRSSWASSRATRSR